MAEAEAGADTLELADALRTKGSGVAVGSAGRAVGTAVTATVGGFDGVAPGPDVPEVRVD
jgi:hypothetical protein